MKFSLTNAPCSAHFWCQQHHLSGKEAVTEAPSIVSWHHIYMEGADRSRVKPINWDCLTGPLLTAGVARAGASVCHSHACGRQRRCTECGARQLHGSGEGIHCRAAGRGVELHGLHRNQCPARYAALVPVSSFKSSRLPFVAPHHVFNCYQLLVCIHSLKGRALLLTTVVALHGMCILKLNLEP